MKTRSTPESPTAFLKFASFMPLSIFRHDHVCKGFVNE